jgi:hypothetical protein
MSSRSRSEDLAADLLQDIAAEQATPERRQPSAPPGVEPESAAGAAFVDTEFYLAPNTWKRPGIARSGSALSISAGPVRVRLGRRTT